MKNSYKTFYSFFILILCLIVRFAFTYFSDSIYVYNWPFNYVIYLSYLPCVITLLIIIAIHFALCNKKTLKLPPLTFSFFKKDLWKLYILSFLYSLSFIALYVIINLIIDNKEGIFGYKFPVYIYNDIIVLASTLVVIPFLSVFLFQYIICYKCLQTLNWSLKIIYISFILAFIQADPSHSIMELFYLGLILCVLSRKGNFWSAFAFYLFVNLNSIYLYNHFLTRLKILIQNYHVNLIYLLFIVSFSAFIYLLFMFSKIRFHK